MDTAIRHIGIFFFADVEELDAIGPWEVLSHWTQDWPDDGWRVITFSELGGEVRCAKGLTVRVDHSEADRPKLDVLIYPGGQGTRPQLQDPARLDWVRRRSRDGTLMTSVCTGSLVYAAAGVRGDRHGAAPRRPARGHPTSETGAAWNPVRSPATGVARVAQLVTPASTRSISPARPRS